jgi:hypothetical protein
MRPTMENIKTSAHSITAKSCVAAEDMAVGHDRVEGSNTPSLLLLVVVPNHGVVQNCLSVVAMAEWSKKRF